MTLSKFEHVRGGAGIGGPQVNKFELSIGHMGTPFEQIESLTDRQTTDRQTLVKTLLFHNFRCGR